MLHYKLLVFDGAGQFFQRLNFDFENDEAAIHYASIRHRSADAELWRDNLLLGSFTKLGS